MNFYLNERGMQQALEAAKKQVEAKVNADLQRVIWEVHGDMVGQPADQVLAELVLRLEAAIPGVVLDLGQLREVADAIEADDLVP